MAERSVVEEQLLPIITRELNLGDREFTYHDSFTDDLGMTSLMAVELTLKVQEAFGIEIPDEDIDGLKSTGLLIEYIVSHAP